MRWVSWVWSGNACAFSRIPERIVSPAIIAEVHFVPRLNYFSGFQLSVAFVPLSDLFYRIFLTHGVAFRGLTFHSNAHPHLCFPL